MHRPILCFRQTLSSESFRAAVVATHRIALWSIGYQPIALLLSYVAKLAESAGNAPASRRIGISFSRRVPPACIGLDSVGSIAWIRTTTSRINSTVDYLLSHDGNDIGLPGRTCTCDPRLRRAPLCNLSYGELKLVGHLGSAPSVSRFQAGWIAIFLVPAQWRPGRVLPPLSSARQADESAVPLPSRKTGG